MQSACNVIIMITYCIIIEDLDEECTAAILWAGDPLECSSFTPLGNRLLQVKVVTTWHCLFPSPYCTCHRLQEYRRCDIHDKGYRYIYLQVYQSSIYIWGG